MILQPFDFLLLAFRRTIPCQVLRRLVHALGIVRYEQFRRLFLLRQVLDEVGGHDSDRIGEIVVCIGRARSDQFLTMDKRLDAFPLFVLLEEDDRNLAYEIRLLDDLPSDALPRAAVDDVRGVDVEVIDEAVFLFPYIVAPCYGNQILVLIPARVNLISLALGEHSNLNVRRVVRIAENAEKHRTFGL